MKDELIGELEFCLELWREKGYCEFGSKTNCNECAAPYLLLKLINKERLHDKNMKRLSLEEWENKLDNLRRGKK